MSDSNRDPSPNSNTNQRTFRELSTEEQYVHQETNLRALGGRDDMPDFGGLSPVHENDGYRDGDIEHEDYNPSYRKSYVKKTNVTGNKLMKRQNYGKKA